MINKNRYKTDYKCEGKQKLYLYGVIRVSNECNKKAEDHVYKQANEGVQIQPTEQPHQCALLLDLSKRCKHIIAVDQREQTLSHCVQILKLENNEYSFENKTWRLFIQR